MGRAQPRREGSQLPFVGVVGWISQLSINPGGPCGRVSLFIQQITTNKKINSHNGPTPYQHENLDSVRITKTFRSCRPAWLEIDPKVCPTATTLLHKLIELAMFNLVSLFSSFYPEWPQRQ